jgi:hypothetical protein
MRNPKYYRAFNYTIKTLQVLSALIALCGFFLFFGSLWTIGYSMLAFGKCITYLAIGLCFATAGVLSFSYFETAVEVEESGDSNE